ncbi:unnamed protein product [Notodromas monacha]|uniref:U2A'/phosphoprotein 32 family A C-terminal domain-containing protein n=1 Tax=Notodromas monacha TaxID=399045 RepID=A0A7R9G9L2_9CRUS|nr:unnamed protein product [Notodromas monacha]CAG0914376.1 unnamed protein product [Notodromas monacha]
MVKLTPELVTGAYQFLNALRDRYKIPQLENLGATGVSVISLNLFNRTEKMLRIAAALGESLPNLQALILSNNHLQELSDLEPLGNIPSLEIVSLLHNPVVHKPHYRSYVITLLPELRILDFRRVKLAERKEAEKLFKSKKGKEMKRKIETAAKTFVPGGEIETNGDAPPAKKPAGAASTAEMRRIKQMIANATSLEEVERLNLLLQKGQLNPETAKTGNGDSEMDAE